MNADPNRLVHRNAFNISAMSFEPEEIKASIQKIIPDFEMDYDVDPVRQSIAESWPNSLDVSCAQEEWDFKIWYDFLNRCFDFFRLKRHCRYIKGVSVN